MPIIGAALPTKTDWEWVQIVPTEFDNLATIGTLATNDGNACLKGRAIGERREHRGDSGNPSARLTARCAGLGRCRGNLGAV